MKVTDRQRDEQDELRRLLDNPSFRHFLWRLWAQSRMWDTISHVDNPLAMAVDSGKRDIGLSVFAEIEQARPEIYSVIMREAQDRERKYGGTSSRPTSDE
jgi:hypothetical protein